jgi:DNA-3-methyladenine glycosylase
MTQQGPRVRTCGGIVASIAVFADGERPLGGGRGHRAVQPLSRRFFQRDAVTVARNLLGRHLVHETREGRVMGKIVETEAYAGPQDKAAHVAGGRRTARTQIFWGPGGAAYVYMIYGMHHCFNVVTGKEEEPSAVLVRAVAPLEGIDVMARRRGRPVPPPAGDGPSLRFLADLTSGPGRLASAFAFRREHTGLDVTTGPIWITRGRRVSDDKVLKGPRIGVDYAGEDALLDYRFFVKGDPFVSRPWPESQRQAVSSQARRPFKA